MTHGSLFSGIGGFELGAEWAGIDTLWNCEIEKFQEARPDLFWGRNFADEYEAFYYYLHDMTLQDFRFMKTASLFENDFETIVKNWLL